MWDLVYALLQLVANVAAVHYVAPHFSKVWLFVVFMVEPVLRNAIATAGKLTVTNVDDVFYAIVTEVGQFVVYSYFADWEHEARHVFAILCLLKFILTMVATFTTDSDTHRPHRAHLSATFSAASATHIGVSIVPLAYFLFMNCSPFQSPAFLYTTVVFVWFAGSRRRRRAR